MKTITTRKIDGYKIARLSLFSAWPLMAVTGMTLSPPATCMAAEAATTSTIAQVALPANAARLGDKELESDFGRLFHDIGKEREIPEAEASAAEVLQWTGAAYKPGRIGFLRSAFQKALQGAGYDYKEIEPSNIRTNPFEEQYGLSFVGRDGLPKRAVEIGSSNSLRYFEATNPQKQQTLLGMWIEQSDDKKYFLAFAPVGFKAPPKATVLPAVSGANTVLVKDSHNAMKGLPGPPTPPFGKIAVKPGHVRGLVKDAKGNALAGAHIVVQSSAAGGFRTSVQGKTNAQGLYEIALPVGICQVVNADYRVSYNGKGYLLPLKAVDGDRSYFNSKEGQVENFVLHTWGIADKEKAEQDSEWGSAYYGARIRVQWLFTEITPNAIVQITLKPQGPLMGGAPGRTFVFRLPMEGRSERFLNNIPIGRYVMEASMLDGDEQLPMRVEKLWGEAEPAEKLTIDFVASDTTLASLDQSGIAQYEVMVKP